MDAAELDRMSSPLIKAVEDARAVALNGPDSAEFRKVLQHAHEMHCMFIDALRENEALVTPYPLSLSRITGESIAILDAHVAKADGNLH